MTKKELHLLGRIFQTGSFFTLFILSYLIVCFLSTPFSYYVQKVLRINIYNYPYNPDFMFLPTVFLWLLVFFTWCFTTWHTIHPTVHSIPKWFHNFDFLTLTIGCILGFILVYASLKNTMPYNLSLSIAFFPFMAYALGVLWVYTFLYRIKNKTLAQTFYWRQFYIHFPFYSPLGFWMTGAVLLNFFFIYVAFNSMYNDRFFIVFIAGLLFIALSFLVQYFIRYADQLSQSYQQATADKIKSERFRTDLITNVSHDIKTPLTSIINYIDLLKKQSINHSELREYIEVLDKKSKRLKILIEDLLEASKAGTGNVAVFPEAIDLVELIGQLTGEFDEKLEKQNLQLVVKHEIPQAFVWADGRHLWRVMENILGNAVKYAMEGTRIYIEIEPQGSRMLLSIKNISKEPLGMAADELTQQFVRGEKARHTEGSGLGLYIAKSLAEVMNGELEIRISGDLFEVNVFLPTAPGQ